MAVPRTPKGLGAAGRALWRSIHAGLPAALELDERQKAVLRLACDEVDQAARLDAQVAADGLMVIGSAGQPRVHPAVAEARSARAAAARVLGQLHLSTEEHPPKSAAAQHAQHAANARWDRVRAGREQRARLMGVREDDDTPSASTPSTSQPAKEYRIP